MRYLLRHGISLREKMDTTKCKDCTYDERGRLIHTCGPCEEEAIKARIQWWQDGKRKLKEKEGEVT